MLHICHSGFSGVKCEGRRVKCIAKDLKGKIYKAIKRPQEKVIFSGKFQSFVECCWFDSSDLIKTENNSNIEIDEAANNYKRFFNLSLFL